MSLAEQDIGGLGQRKRGFDLELTTAILHVLVTKLVWLLSCR